MHHHNFLQCFVVRFEKHFSKRNNAEQNVLGVNNIRVIDLYAGLGSCSNVTNGLSDFHLNVTKAALVIGMMVVVGIGGQLVRTRLRLQTPPALIEAMVQVSAVSLFVVLMTYQLGSLGAPWADPWLAALDRLVGFDWVATNRFVEHHEPLVRALRFSYGAILWELPLVIVLLAFRMSHRRLAQFLLAWMLSLTLTTVGFALAPAKTAYVYYGATQGALPELSRQTGQLPFEIIEQLRAGGLRLLLDQDVAGLVTFPSFHTAAGVLFAWALWSTRWMRWPAVIVNGLMIASTPIIGAHYLVDLVGGVAVAIVAIKLARKWMEAPSH